MTDAHWRDRLKCRETTGSRTRQNAPSKGRAVIVDALNDPDKRAVAGGAVGMTMSGVIEDGMATMSQKFKEMGGQVYLDAEKVKESNRVL